MNDNNRNLIVAVALSALLLLGWQYFVAAPQMKLEQQRHALLAQQQKQKNPSAPQTIAPPQATPASPIHLSRTAALKQSGPRIPIRTPTVDGSLLLRGARFDDLKLKAYHVTVDPKSPEIDLLAPSGSEYPYFAEFGWSSANSKIAVPGDETPWRLENGNVLSPGKPITLSWDNGQGLVFRRVISVDDKYMFTITDSVANGSGTRVQLYPYALAVRDGVPPHQTMSLLHEGFVGIADGKLQDPSYKDFDKDDKAPETFTSTGGWLGITDKYWMAALIPPQNEKYNGAFRAAPYNTTRSYQANYSLSGRTLEPGGTVTVSQRLFAGAKVVDILYNYEDKDGIEMFDYAVDWGWFFILTRPLFWVLDWFYRLVGNFGLAIVLATVLIRLLLFPLANSQFKSMNKMKRLQPEMERIKKAHADDPQRQQQEMMELYKREKANPLLGCLPMLIQFPILFSFYKVMYVTIEMFHAPFVGWIRDLSAPDPTSFINLFGLLPFTVPQTLPGLLAPLAIVLHVGAWPVIMGITQWVQFKMNPAPGDPVQAKMFAFMPLIFTVMFATFPSGLVIYWTWNNLLSMAQQGYMMKREGVPIHLFENLKPPQFLRPWYDKIRRLFNRSKFQASE
jgi:YidC/Oxa1 family membrane protein insertase